MLKNGFLQEDIKGFASCKSNLCNAEYELSKFLYKTLRDLRVLNRKSVMKYLVNNCVVYEGTIMKDWGKVLLQKLSPSKFSGIQEWYYEIENATFALNALLTRDMPYINFLTLDSTSKGQRADSGICYKDEPSKPILIFDDKAGCTFSDTNFQKWSRFDNLVLVRLLSRREDWGFEVDEAERTSVGDVSHERLCQYWAYILLKGLTPSQKKKKAKEIFTKLSKDILQIQRIV